MGGGERHRVQRLITPPGWWGTARAARPGRCRETTTTAHVRAVATSRLVVVARCPTALRDARGATLGGTPAPLLPLTGPVRAPCARYTRPGRLTVRPGTATAPRAPPVRAALCGTGPLGPGQLQLVVRVSGLRQQHVCGGAVAGIRGSDHHLQQQTEGVDHDLPLAPVDQLVAVEAAPVGAEDGVRLDRLRVRGRLSAILWCHERKTPRERAAVLRTSGGSRCSRPISGAVRDERLADQTTGATYPGVDGSGARDAITWQSV